MISLLSLESNTGNERFMVGLNGLRRIYDRVKDNG